jgi:DeoR family transcriptional regulator, fructose operon transcriptional repressor
MLQHQRHARILEIVKQRQTCTLDELRAELDISPITLYRDLRKLDENNVIRRVHGGVTLREPDPISRRFPDRLSNHAAAKESIAQEAAELVREGSSVFLDASSTTYFLALRLAQRELPALTLVTTAPGIPLLFEARPQISIISTGGELHHSLNTYGGPITMRVLEEMNFGAAFVSCAGFSLTHGATTDSPMLAEVLRRVAARSREVVLLVDSSKFSRVGMMTSLRAKEITRIVTDGEAPDDLVHRLQDAGVEVIRTGLGERQAADGDLAKAR